MRYALLATVSAASLLAGCAPELFPSARGLFDLPALLAGDLSQSPLAPSTSKAGGAERRAQLGGRLSGEFTYDLYSLGAGQPGEVWTVRPAGLLGGSFVVALFDHQMNLLYREYMGMGGELRHVLREPTADVQVGVMVPSGRGGGRYSFEVTVRPEQSPPGPRRQLVWLNFAGGQDVKIHTRAALSFPPFDAAAINPDYVDQTQIVKDVIVAAMRADYAGYDLEIISSDQAERPAEPHSVVHFGGAMSGLLGLADSVDSYNNDESEAAIIYVESFVPYWTMQLTAEQMGVMIANVASHELGHLLGLYHTQSPGDVMDTTGTAWDLAGEQGFGRAPLEITVFATGAEDSPRLLSQILGPVDVQKASPAAARVAKIPAYRAVRRFVQAELPYACETCLLIDAE